MLHISPLCEGLIFSFNLFASNIAKLSNFFLRSWFWFGIGRQNCFWIKAESTFPSVQKTDYLDLCFLPARLSLVCCFLRVTCITIMFVIFVRNVVWTKLPRFTMQVHTFLFFSRNICMFIEHCSTFLSSFIHIIINLCTFLLFLISNGLDKPCFRLVLIFHFVWKHAFE